jgi:hypothetical protein
MSGSPVLVVRDRGVRPVRRTGCPLAVGAGCAAVYRSICARLMGRAALVGVRRVSPEEARRISRTATLPDANTAALSTMSDGLTLWYTHRARQLVRTVPTDSETRLPGQPSLRPRPTVG